MAAHVSRAAIINAGDREPGQHPTQALLDLRTIFKRLGRVDDINIAMVGDLLNGRTVRSLCYLLSKFTDIKIRFVSPENAMMAHDIKHHLHKHDVSFDESNDLRFVAPDVDVIYQTRAQEECGTEIDYDNHDLGYFKVDQEICDLMPKTSIIMHPLPRNDEISLEVDNNLRAVYLTDQIDSGLFTRMALLKMILAPDA